MEIVFKELKKVAITTAILDVLVLAGGLLCGISLLRLAASLLFGSLFALANFLLLGSICQKACQKKPAQAKRYMQLNYTVRLLLTAVVITAAFLLPYLHPIGVIIPLFAPKLTYFSTALAASLRKKTKQVP